MTEDLSLIDVSHQCDPDRTLIRNLSVGDRVQLVASRNGDESFLLEAKIREVEGSWSNRIYLGDSELDPVRDELFDPQWDGAIAFRREHVLAAWPQPSEGWASVRDDLRTAIVDAVAGEMDESVPRAAVFAVLDDILRDPAGFLAEVEAGVKGRVESALQFHKIFGGMSEDDDPGRHRE